MREIKKLTIFIVSWSKIPLSNSKLFSMGHSISSYLSNDQDALISSVPIDDRPEGTGFPAISSILVKDNSPGLLNLLPMDILILIGSHLNARSLGFLSRISWKLYHHLITTGYLLGTIRTKLQTITRLDLTEYPLDELGFLIRRSQPRPSLSGGNRHSLFLDSQGRVYGFGSNQDGQLGLGGIVTQFIPILIKEFKSQIIVVSAGSYHSLFLDSQGQVYSCGCNTLGRLGLGDHKYSHIHVPTPIDNQEMGQILAISAGGTHSLFLNSEGQVFSCGYGRFGRLGLRDEKDRKIPTLIPTTGPGTQIGKVAAISAGKFTSLILNSQGQVFSFGSDNRGNHLAPTLIEEIKDRKIVAISASRIHSLFLDSQGQVFILGSIDCGHVHTRSYMYSKPFLIEETKEGTKIGEIIAISAKEYHSLLLNSRGQVFGFGCNQYDQLGLGNLGSRFAPTLTEIKVPHRIIAIAAGDQHSLLLTSQGQILGFGNNSDGRLGSGSNGENPFVTLFEDYMV
jgi:alpha-tubulin suppressor-like RCC1 family protein